MQNHPEFRTIRKLPPGFSLCTNKYFGDPRVRVKDPLQFFDIVITPVCSFSILWRIFWSFSTLPISSYKDLQGGSNEPCIGNLPVHVLQDMPDMTGHQNFNRTPGIDGRTIGTRYTLASNMGLWIHLTENFVIFASGPDPIKIIKQNNEHFVGHFPQFFKVPAANTGCPQACRMNVNLKLNL